MGRGRPPRWATLAATLVLLAPLVPRIAGAQPVLIDDFETVGGWTVAASAGSAARLAWESGPRGTALRLDFELAGGTGFVILRRADRLTLPDNFAFTFDLRGQGPRGTFELKVVDRDGQNVWWRRFPEFSFPPEWQRMTVRKSRLAFAWGPAPGSGPRDVGALEFGLAASEGGSGTIWLDDLVLEPREPMRPGTMLPDVEASSARPGAEPSLALDGVPATAWRSAPEDAPQWLQIDFGTSREFGGLAIDWDAADYGVAYGVSVSADGNTWTTVYESADGKGGRQYVYMPDTEARFVRIEVQRASRSRGIAIAEVVVKPVEFSESPNAFFAAIAYDARPGTYPKYLAGKQTYWTVVGVDGDGMEALVNEEGMVEVDRAFSLEPFLYRRGQLVTWKDVEITQELDGGSLPMPTVVWRLGGMRLRITAFASGQPGQSTLHLRYRLENTGTRREQVQLFVAIRPFQVTPPWQALNMQGGVTQIRELRWDGNAVWVDRTRAIVPFTSVEAFGAATFEEGAITDYLLVGVPPEHAEVTDAFGFASGAMQFDMAASPGQVREAALAVPFELSSTQALPQPARGAVAARQAEVRERWARMLGRVEFLLPPSEARLVETLRSTIAYILVNRDGPSLRPGSRNYARSWIRDGAMSSEALLQTGFTAEVREFLRWYAGFQTRDGRVPCCVDRRGPDWTPEHDSVGAFIYAIAEYYRFTRDAGFVHDVWPNVVRGVEYLETLRAQRMTDRYRQPGMRAFLGLMPESISHEGYSGHPVHSYWDDFFTLRGLKDAAALAVVVGDDDRAEDYAKLRDAFRDSLLASLAETMSRDGIGYLPGSVELGDYDPSSTSIAIAPGGELGRLPINAVLHTYERYWQEIQTRLRGQWEGQAYSPYELRNVGVFVQLGWRDRAHALLDYLMRGRRPEAWNEWAEVVWLDRDLPRFIGDMPHTWAGAGFVQSLRSMFAYERESDHALVVGAGLQPGWIASERGAGVRRLPTHYGTLNYTMRAEGPNVVRLKLSGDVTVPPGRIVVPSPLRRRLASATVNGQPVEAAGADAIVLDTCPAEAEFRYDPEGE